MELPVRAWWLAASAPPAGRRRPRSASAHRRRPRSASAHRAHRRPPGSPPRAAPAPWRPGRPLRVGGPAPLGASGLRTASRHPLLLEAREGPCASVARIPWAPVASVPPARSRWPAVPRPASGLRATRTPMAAGEAFRSLCGRRTPRRPHTGGGRRCRSLQATHAPTAAGEGLCSPCAPAAAGEGPLALPPSVVREEGGRKEPAGVVGK